jgi:HK97 gp10 family phage protein
MAIDGLDKALRAMRELPRRIRRAAVRKATGKGAAIIRAKAKENALRTDDPETGRRIADNIGQRVRSGHFRRTGDTMISVGVLTGKGRIPRGNPDGGRRGNTPHWHLIELGTENSPAQPFLRPAAAESVDAVFDAVGTELERQVGLELDKL